MKAHTKKVLIVVGLLVAGGAAYAIIRNKTKLKAKADTKKAFVDVIVTATDKTGMTDADRPALMMLSDKCLAAYVAAIQKNLTTFVCDGHVIQVMDAVMVEPGDTTGDNGQYTPVDIPPSDPYEAAWDWITHIF